MKPWRNMTRAERVAALQPLWNEQCLTGAQCAAALGTTRGAIMGTVNRNQDDLTQRGFTPPTSKRRTPTSRTPRAPRPLRYVPRKRVTGRADNLTARRIATAAALRARHSAEAPPVDGGVSILALAAGMCRFVTGIDAAQPRGQRHRFCGEPIAAGSYCFEHYSLVYSPGAADDALNAAALQATPAPQQEGAA